MREWHCANECPIAQLFIVSSNFSVRCRWLSLRGWLFTRYLEAQWHSKTTNKSTFGHSYSTKLILKYSSQIFSGSWITEAYCYRGYLLLSNLAWIVVVSFYFRVVGNEMVFILICMYVCACVRAYYVVSD